MAGSGNWNKITADNCSGSAILQSKSRFSNPGTTKLSSLRAGKYLADLLCARDPEQLRVPRGTGRRRFARIPIPRDRRDGQGTEILISGYCSTSCRKYDTVAV